MALLEIMICYVEFRNRLALALPLLLGKPRIIVNPT